VAQSALDRGLVIEAGLDCTGQYWITDEAAVIPDRTASTQGRHRTGKHRYTEYSRAHRLRHF
jgi:hypothetical protein